MVLPFAESRPALRIARRQGRPAPTYLMHSPRSDRDIFRPKRFSPKFRDFVVQGRGEDALKYAESTMAASELLRGAGILITPEQQRMEVADFGLGDLAKTGLQILTYVNTERVCAKELIMIPGQTCPEHWHPTIGGVPGREETFRCRWGSVSLYVPGERTGAPRCRPPAGSEAYYTVGREIHLEPGQQYTILPDTPHWFQAGPQGAIVSEFSTRSTDEADAFRDPRIRRMAGIGRESSELKVDS
jgi:D-lyxose ketol-isomerase